MPGVLLDTNILLRASDPGSPLYAVATEAVAQLLAGGEQLYITAQNLVEFWAVATRPVSANGLGWSVQKTRDEIDRLLAQFSLLEDSPAIFVNWLDLVSIHSVEGKATHDARLVAVMQSYGIVRLLTFNTDDFARYPHLTLLHPTEVTSS
jgi:predicted nucleic acid-binding protein